MVFPYIERLLNSTIRFCLIFYCLTLYKNNTKRTEQEATKTLSWKSTFNSHDNFAFYKSSLSNRPTYLMDQQAQSPLAVHSSRRLGGIQALTARTHTHKCIYIYRAPIFLLLFSDCLSACFDYCLPRLYSTAALEVQRPVLSSWLLDNFSPLCGCFK